MNSIEELAIALHSVSYAYSTALWDRVGPLYQLRVKGMQGRILFLIFEGLKLFATIDKIKLLGLN